MSPAASPSTLGCLGLAIMGAVAVVGCRGGGSGGDLCITAANCHLVVRSAGRTGSQSAFSAYFSKGMRGYQID